MSDSFQPPAVVGKVSLALKLLRVGVVAVIGAWFLLLAAWLALHWLILPNIEQWRGPIEQRASAAFGTDVKIGRIEVRSSGWVPAFELRDVRFLDAQGREALYLERVAAAVSARSLLHLAPRFEQLLIDAPTLEVRRDAAGRLSVAGFEMSSGAGGGDGGGAEWFFSQREFVIRGGTVRWVDERSGESPLLLKAVQLVVRNTLRRHDVRFDATPPAAFGAPFSIRGKFNQTLLARRGDWKRWSGRLYAEMPHAEVPALRERFALPFDLDQGRGALRAWVEFRQGRAMSATVDAVLQDVSMRLDPSLERLEFQQLSGRFEALRSAEGVSFAADDFAFTGHDGQAWPQGLLRLALRQVDDGEAGAATTPVTGGDFSADHLDLEMLASLASRLPLSQATRESLAQLSPSGEVSALKARWDGPIQSPARYQVDARVKALSLAAGPADSGARHAVGRPGLRNATLAVSASERGGEASVDMAEGVIDLPGVFDEPQVALHSLEGRLAWRIASDADVAAPRLELEARGVRFANADASGHFEAKWNTGSGPGAGRGGRLPGVLDLEGELQGGRAQQVARYLPRALPESVRTYVAQAVRGGTLPTVSFKVKGDLADFPASNPQQGEFRIVARVHDASFDFAPGHGWPVIGKLGGELAFERNAMTIRNARGHIGALALAGVNGGIARLGERPVLLLDGSGSGALVDGLALVNSTPIGGWIDQALAQASGTGPADLKLALEIPLDDRPASARGSVALAGNDLRLRPDLPMLRNARGRVDFTHDSFTLVGASARLLGGDASLAGGLAPGRPLRFDIQGTASAEGLRGATELSRILPFAASLSGQAAYRLGVGWAQGQPEILLTSTLQGLASELPAPLRKSAESALPLRFEIRQEPRAGDTAPLRSTTPLRDTLSLDLGQALHASYAREYGSDGPSRVLRGGIGLGVEAPTPAKGVAANVHLGALDVDAWERTVSGWSLSAGGGSAGADAGGANVEGFMPTHIGLRLGTLDVSGRRLTRLVAGLSREDSTWRASAEADQLAGYAQWRPAVGSPGQLQARLTRLNLPPTEVESVETMLESPGASQPALDIVINDLTLRERRLGRVEIQAEHRASTRGSGLAWRLSKLTMSVPEARLVASGHWLEPGSPGQRARSLLDLNLEIDDSGALLERLGTHGALRGGKGVLSGQLGWVGSPLSPDLASLSGTLELAMASGQFLKAEPGAARLLGVLSLQALPRRLMLDFRDLFDEGFAFDDIGASVRVDRGVAKTSNLRIRGVQAAVLMEGEADLVGKTQQLHVIVVPEINAGTASLAYAVINPAIGLGTFLAQLALRKPIIEAGTREFNISGSWSDPKVEPVARASGAPVPDLDTATPAASAASSPR